MSLLCFRNPAFSCTPPKRMPYVYLPVSGRRAGESGANFLIDPLCINNKYYLFYIKRAVQMTVEVMSYNLILVFDNQ